MKITAKRDLSHIGDGILTIIIDSNEPHEIENALKDQRLTVERQRLPAGDYAFSDVLIERKTINDFGNTLFQGRLFPQMFKLKDACNRPVLMIVGKYPFVFTKQDLAKRRAIQAAKWSIILELKIPVLECASDQEFVEGLVLSYLRSNKDRPSLKPVMPKKHDIKEVREDILTRLPGIGRLSAKLIIEDTVNIANLCNKSVEEIDTYKGITTKNAELIKQILCGGAVKKEERNKYPKDNTILNNGGIK